MNCWTMTDTYSTRARLEVTHTVTFEDGHVDEGADLWDMPEPSGGRLDSAAVLWLYVITAAPAGQRFSLRRHWRHPVSEGQEDEEDAQHCCAYKKKHDRHVIWRALKVCIGFLTVGTKQYVTGEQLLCLCWVIRIHHCYITIIHPILWQSIKELFQSGQKPMDWIITQHFHT